jgi:hypothetical protein
MVGQGLTNFRSIAILKHLVLQSQATTLLEIGLLLNPINPIAHKQQCEEPISKPHVGFGAIQKPRRYRIETTQNSY